VLYFDVFNVYTVNDDFARDDLDNAAECEAQRALASTGSANDTDTLTTFDFKAELLKGNVRLRPVLDAHIHKLYVALARPVGVTPLECVKRQEAFHVLLWDLE